MMNQAPQINHIVPVNQWRIRLPPPCHTITLDPVYNEYKDTKEIVYDSLVLVITELLILLSMILGQRNPLVVTGCLF